MHLACVGGLANGRLPIPTPTMHIVTGLLPGSQSPVVYWVAGSPPQIQVMYQEWSESAKEALNWYRRQNVTQFWAVECECETVRG